MKAHAIRLLNDEHLIATSHWMVFALGAASLALSLGAAIYQAVLA